MMLAVCFTNFGPYHLARLRALADRLARRGDHLIAYEMAGAENRYPWSRLAGSEPFTWTTFYPDRPVESLSRSECVQSIVRALDRDRPHAVGIVGYARHESMAALRWANRNQRPTILMSESQEIDHPRVWWKEAIKRRLVRRFSSGLVGGPRHRDYLVKLGMPAERIALGYNAVDNEHFTRQAAEARHAAGGREGLPARPYFVAVNRFVPEKNLLALIEAYAGYRQHSGGGAWDLVLCGAGEQGTEIRRAITAAGLNESVHLPGFKQADEVARIMAFASAFVHPSRMEPWGLVVNEAAACGLPLLVSDRAGCAETLVPDPPGTTGRRFRPDSVAEIKDALQWMASLGAGEREAMGQRAFECVSNWGPERFAEGTLEALDLAAPMTGNARNSIRRESSESWRGPHPRTLEPLGAEIHR